MIRTGVDLIEVDRIRRAVRRHGRRFLDRIYTERELAYCAERVESLAVRFAAKEAIAKALGIGVWRHAITWRDLEVMRDQRSGEPSVLLHNAALARAQTLGIQSWSLSLSHDRKHAIAFVVGVCKVPGT